MAKTKSVQLGVCDWCGQIILKNRTRCSVATEGERKLIAATGPENCKAELKKKGY